jgi:hypothetical protein
MKMRIMESLRRFMFYVEEYNDHPPSWFFEGGDRYQMYRRDCEASDEGYAGEMRDRAAFYLELGWQIRRFVTSTLVCWFVGHQMVVEGPEYGTCGTWLMCERCGETEGDEDA